MGFCSKEGSGRQLEVRPAAMAALHPHNIRHRGSFVALQGRRNIRGLGDPPWEYGAGPGQEPWQSELSPVP